jgi:hypothetical protein
MASVDLSRRVEKVVGYPPLSEMGDLQRREFHEALREADCFEDLPGKLQTPARPGRRGRPAGADEHRGMSARCSHVPTRQTLISVAGSSKVISSRNTTMGCASDVRDTSARACYARAADSRDPRPRAGVPARPERVGVTGD